jgi:Holliday junction resolvasome RuvABC ATP-dependent DNA helicase subunit
VKFGGEALAEQLLDYLQFRAAGRSATRLLVTNYPAGVLEMACRTLVRTSKGAENGDLHFSFGDRSVPVALALIQAPQTLAAGGLLEEGGYAFGASPDFPVALRNRGGNVVVAVAPDLLDLCHESLKTNSFQSFHENRRFGTDVQVFRRLARNLFEDEARVDLVAEIFRAVRQVETRRRGDEGDVRTFERIDALANAADRSAGIDWRLLGILPQRQLEIVLERTGSKPREATAAVRNNARFQSDLVEGLAREQYRHITKRYGGSSKFDRLAEFLAQWDFRLTFEDDGWRLQWPSDLPIEDLLQVRVVEPRTGVRSLRVGAPLTLGLPIVQGPFEVTWRLSRAPTAVPGEVVVDDERAIELDLKDGRAELAEPGSPGHHVVELAADDVELIGQTSTQYFVPRAEGDLLATVGTAAPGQPLYRVAPGSSFRVRWALLPSSVAAEGFVLRIDSGQGEAAVEHPLGPGVRWFDFNGGTEDSIEIRVEARRSNGQESWAAEFHVDVFEEPVRERPVPMLGAALVRLAKDLAGSAEEERPPVDIDVDARGDTFEIRFTTEEGILDTRTYRVAASDALAEFEQAFLDAPGQPWPRILAQTRRGRGVIWFAAKYADAMGSVAESLPSDEWDAFLRTRREVIASLREAGGVARARLSDHADVIVDYARAYRDLLSSIAAAEEDVGRAHVLANLVDCVLVSKDPPLLAEGIQDTAFDGSISAILVSPTHPLRLAWLCELERRLERLLSRSEAWSTFAMEAIESKNLPPCLIDWDYGHFHAATTASGGRWGVLLREGEPEVDKLFPQRFSRLLDLDSPREATTATPLQLARAVVQYQELHPQKDAIRVGYVNPGSGEKLLEAAEQLVGGAVAPDGELAKYTASQCRYDLSLIDLWDDEPDWQTGAAFGAYAEGEGDPEVLERVLYALHRMEADKFASNSVRVPGTHVLFGSDVFQLSGRTEPLRERATAPTFGGLIVNGQRTFERGEAPSVLTHAFVPRPEGWGERAGEVSVEDAIHGVLFGLQAIASASIDRRTISQTHGRALVAEVDPLTARAIERMHEISKWVYLMDSHVDVEYFDQPDLGEQYVIDYVPRLLAASRSSRPHNYVVTTRDDAAIRAAINRFLYSAYGADLVPDRAAERLSEALNRISGHLLLRLSGEPAWAKGAVGLGLVQLLYQGMGLLGGRLDGEYPRQMRVLVPLDDYVAEWLREFRSLRGGTARGERADLLDVAVQLLDDRATVVLQILEVKNRRGGYSIGDLRSGPLQQILGTAAILQTLFGVGSDEARSDKPVKDYQLAQLLDFHLRRTAMQQWGNDPEALALSRRFRSETFRAIISGEYRAAWRVSHGVPMLGAVVQLNAGQEYPGASRAPESVVSDSGMALYVSIGRGEIGRLLDGEAPDGAENLRDSLQPSWPSGEEPGEVVPPDHGGPGPRPPAHAPAAGAGAGDGDAQALEELLGGEPEGTPRPTEGDGATDRAEEATSRRAFDGFVGNEQAVRRLVPWLVVAIGTDPPRLPENIAFTGPASTGKTELSRRIARALRLPFLQTTGAGLYSLDDLLARMALRVTEDGLELREVGREGGLPVLRFPPMVVFVDEAHEMSARVQDELLTLLEPQDRRGTGSHFVGDASNVTFVLATTEWGDLIATLRSRLQRVPLQPYTQAEVAQIVYNRYPFDRDICRRLATAGRLLPRVALQRAQEFSNALEAYPDADQMELLDEYFALWHLDAEGVTEEDRRYMRILDQNPGPVGLQRLADQLGIGQKEITQTIEPYLIVALGYVEITGRGRRLTENGKSYLRSLPA